MSSPDLEAACRAWSDALGQQRVSTDTDTLSGYHANVTGLRGEVAAVVRPASVTEVRQVVEVANRHRVPLYPISGGKNWGLGSRLPVRAGCAVVDLGEMNRIRQVSSRYRYAVVEPGVTQGGLYRHLEEHDLPLMLDVTGAGTETSVLGNSLERGIAYFGLRVERVLGLEVVLGNGKVVRTGFGHYPRASAEYLYPYGVGPDLSGLFFQSNFGIVTSMAIELLPRPDFHAAMICNVADARLPDFVEALRGLREQGLIRNTVHIANAERGRINLSPAIYRHLRQEGREGSATELVKELVGGDAKDMWGASAGLDGTREHVLEAQERIAEALAGIGEVRYFTDDDFEPGAEKNALLHALEPLYGLTRGVPTDAALDSVHWHAGDRSGESREPDLSRSGLLFCLPFFPFDGETTRDVMDDIEGVCREYGIRPAVTLNTVNDRTLEAVISLPFDRSDREQSDRAHVCCERLHDTLIEKGHLPYRVGIHLMGKVIDEADAFWQTVRSLKRELDPNEIIAPGRYNLV